jgi:hypothetical protein
MLFFCRKINKNHIFKMATLTPKKRALLHKKIINSDRDFIDADYYKKFSDAPKQSLQEILKEVKTLLIEQNNELFDETLGNISDFDQLTEVYDEVLAMANEKIGNDDNGGERNEAEKEGEIQKLLAKIEKLESAIKGAKKAIVFIKDENKIKKTESAIRGAEKA